MAKNTAFNGIPLPAISTFEPETGEVAVVRRFEYKDFRGGCPDQRSTPFDRRGPDAIEERPKGETA